MAEQRQSNEDIIKCKDLLSTYQKSLKERYDGKLTIGMTSDNKTSMEFSNGSRIIALPATEKVRGYSSPAIVWIDEAAFVDDEVFVGLEPMLEAGQGQLILSSTPNGPQGFFWREWNNPAYERWDVPWTMVPHFSKESIDQKRMLYGEAYVAQEYECQFLDNVDSMFTDAGLRESLDDTEEVFMEEATRMGKAFESGINFV